jgi:hypothetical protein
MSDARAVQAREEHRRASADEQSAARRRATRDRLVRELRAEDAERWTYPALAAAVGCSPELIAAIVTRRRETRSRRGPRGSR